MRKRVIFDIIQLNLSAKGNMSAVYEKSFEHHRKNCEKQKQHSKSKSMILRIVRRFI